MKRQHLFTGFLFIALSGSGAKTSFAQYIGEYKASDKPSVEVNLDILNDIQERQYRAEHDVAQEPLPTAPADTPAQEGFPAPVAAPAPAAAPPQKRLLKPVFTARPPVMEPAQELAPEEMAAPPQEIRRYEFSPSASESPSPQPRRYVPSYSVVDDMVDAPLPARKPHAVPSRAAEDDLLRQLQNQAPGERMDVESPVSAAPAPVAETGNDEPPLSPVTAPIEPATTSIAPAAEDHEVALYEAPAEAPAPRPDEPVMPVVPALADLTLSFMGNSSDLTAESQRKLDGVIRQLAETVEGRLQVRGYAAGEEGSPSSARRIALSRALAVRSYLMDRGVKPTRVDVRALGTETDRAPPDRVDLIFAR